MEEIILGKGVTLTDGVGASRPNNNQIIVGSSGTGKSMSVLWPTLCRMNESSFIGTFAKGTEVNKAIPYFRKKGYKVHVWNLADPSKGDPLPDPLSYIRSENDIEELANSIAYCNPAYSRSSHFDPYWLDSAQGLITGLISYVMCTEKPLMKDVILLHNALWISESEGRAIQTTLDGLIDWLNKCYPDSLGARRLKAFAQLPYNTAGCVRDSLDKALQSMFPRAIEENMNPKGSVDFEKFATERTAIFIITSPVNTITYCFANLLFGIAIERLMEFAESRSDGRLPRSVRLIFDDFACGFPVQNYEKSIATFRAAGISSLMLVQSESQLDATYGHDNSTTILDNCSAYVYFPGGMNKQTCRSVAQTMDLPMEDIMFMEMGNEIVMQSGRKPQIVPRYDTLNDPYYRELQEQDEISRE